MSSDPNSSAAGAHGQPLLATDAARPRESTGNSCKSCATLFSGRYCPNCGEKVLAPGDRTLSKLLEDFVATVFSLDGKLPRSLRLLLSRPGFLAKEYIEGRRAPYMPPLALFFVANLIFFLYLPFDGFSSHLYNQTETQFYSPLIDDLVARRVEAAGLTRDQFASLYDAHSSNIAKLLLILLVPLFGALFAAVFHNRKRYFFEHLIFALHFVTFIMWVQALLIPFALMVGVGLTNWMGWTAVNATLLMNSAGMFVLQSAVNSVFVYAAANRYYGGARRVNALRAIATAVIFYALVISLYRLILFFATFLTVSAP